MTTIDIAMSVKITISIKKQKEKCNIYHLLKNWKIKKIKRSMLNLGGGGQIIIALFVSIPRLNLNTNEIVYKSFKCWEVSIVGMF